MPWIKHLKQTSSEVMVNLNKILICFQLRILFNLLPIKDCLTLASNKLADGDSNVRLVEVAIERMSKHDDFNASAPTSDMRTVSY